MSRRPLLIALFIAACGSDKASVHDLTTCGSTWAGSAGGSCELGCEEMLGPDPVDEVCYSVTTGHPFQFGDMLPPGYCDHVGITATGERGCCKGADGAIRFWECCDGQRGSDGSLTFTCPK
jgi:hypothetical protein